MNRRCDALIIGGGPAGATAGCLLARAGWCVVIAERQRFPRRKVCGEYLSGTNRPLFAELGVRDAFDAAAGPDVRRVGLFAGSAEIVASLPKPERGWGRACPRDRLDKQMLDLAADAGAEILQPCEVESLTSDGDGWHCRTQSHGEIQSAIVIAAHGSWHAGALPTQPKRRRPHGSDLFGFKAHFRNTQLPSDLMPLLSFPGGYGGMVHVGDDTISLSCCVRRDALARWRAGSSADAGEVVESHIRSSCVGVGRALDGAERVDHWLAAGPIRPGMRLRWPRGIFAVGNAAGEAHPVVAEGISTAMQSAWLLTRELERWGRRSGKSIGLTEVAERYAGRWRRSFRPRLIASEIIARWAMSPRLMSASIPILRRCPAILTWGAAVSGKSTRVIHNPVLATASVP